MSFKSAIKKTWEFLKADTWQSWIVSLVLIILLLKLIIFPSLALIFNTSLPLVVVESCSMYHQGNFESWWNANGPKYDSRNISKELFSSFSLKNGLNKGDIVLVRGKSNYEQGDIIIFLGGTQYPIIHRLISTSPYQTLGDNNPSQLSVEHNIQSNQVLGKAVLKIPFAGWIKLIFFEFSKPADQRGLCK